MLLRLFFVDDAFRRMLNKYEWATNLAWAHTCISDAAAILLFLLFLLLFFLLFWLKNAA